MFIFFKVDYKLFKEHVEHNILSLCVIDIAKCIACLNKVVFKSSLYVFSNKGLSNSISNF